MCGYEIVVIFEGVGVSCRVNFAILGLQSWCGFFVGKGIVCEKGLGCEEETMWKKGKRMV